MAVSGYHPVPSSTGYKRTHISKNFTQLQLYPGTGYVYTFIPCSIVLHFGVGARRFSIYYGATIIHATIPNT